MPTKQIKNSFNSGEQSEYLTGRTDLAKYFTGCSKLINGNVLTYGGVEKRPGTIYRADAKAECRVVAFEFSTDDTHVLEFGVNYMRVFKDGVQAVIPAAGLANWDTGGGTEYSINDMVEDTGSETGNYYYCNTAHTSSAGTDIDDAGDLANWTAMTASGTDLIYELFTPFGSIAEIKAFHTTQSADVMYVASDGSHPQKVSRFGDTDWTIIDVPFTGGPFLDENTDDDLTLTFTHDEVAFDSPHYHLVGAQGTLISTGHTPFLAGHVGSIWQLASTRTDDVTVTQVVVGTSQGIPIKGTLSVDASGFPSGSPFATLTLQRKEGNGEWQDFRAFTSAVAYTAEELFDDVSYRLVLAGAAISSAVLTAQEQIQLGAVHIDSFTNTSSVEATVTNDVYHSHLDAVSFVDDPGTINFGGTGAGAGDVSIDLVTHGFTTGDRVFFSGITLSNYLFLNNDGTQDITFLVTVTDVDTFTVDDTDGLGGDTVAAVQVLNEGNVQELSSCYHYIYVGGRFMVKCERLSENSYFPRRQIVVGFNYE